MCTKFICTLFFVLSGAILFAQNHDRMKYEKHLKSQNQQKNRKNQTSQNNQGKQVVLRSVQTSNPRREFYQLMKRDPRLPEFNSGTIKKYLDFMKEKYALREFPRKAQEFRKENRNTSMGLSMAAFSYKKKISHPDIEEATGIRMSWYNKVGTAFVALFAPLEAVERAAMIGDSKQYVMAALKYKTLAKELEKILDKPEKIPSRELEKIKENNTARRKKEIQKKINELLKKRGND